MKTIHGKLDDWSKSNYKKSFENLVSEGYDYNRIELKKWFDLEGWQTAVLVNKLAKKVIQESEKAIKFNVVNQYGEEYNMWFPKSALENY